MTTGTTLAVALPRPAEASLAAVLVLAAALVAATTAGVAQARRMTRLRQDALRHPGSTDLAAKVRRGARDAAALRATIAALSLALLALGTVIAT